jgi:hypothetical protein
MNPIFKLARRTEFVPACTAARLLAPIWKTLILHRFSVGTPVLDAARAGTP